MQDDNNQFSSKLLLIDDDFNLKMLLKHYLEFQGYQVMTANNGSQALSIVEKYIPDVIICDVMMPEVDGYEFVAKLRKRQDIGWIPVLFLSALDQSFDRIKGLEIGADVYMRKPFEPEELLAQVKSMLNQSIQIQQQAKTMTPTTTSIQVDPAVKITPTELKVLRLIAKGFRNKQIAAELNLSKRTIESHISNLLGKTGLKNRTELAMWIIESRME